MKDHTETNRLIAEFMNRQDSRINDTGNGIIWETQTKSLKYHEDWNWLMEVVEKIETMKHEDGSFYRIITEGHESWLSTTSRGMKNLEHLNIHASIQNRILGTYNTVVQFIKWHNQNENP